MTNDREIVTVMNGDNIENRVSVSALHHDLVALLGKHGFDAGALILAKGQQVDLCAEGLGPEDIVMICRFVIDAHEDPSTRRTVRPEIAQ